MIFSGIQENRLLEVLNYMKKYWKDYFRPTLTSLSCEAVGGEFEIAEDAGLVFTLASSGFGLHDDILDKSLFKHLRETILGRYGIDRALLVGDLLIIKGWTIFHKMIRNTKDPKKIANIIETYSNLCLEICQGEFMETLCRRNLETDLSYYEKILWSAMAEAEACTKIGAIMGDGKPYEVEALAEFGRRLGFNSRLKDDLEDCLNVKGDLLNRIEHESIPFPLLFAAKSSKKIFVQINDIIKKPQITPMDAKNLLKFCFETEAFEYIRRIGEKNKIEAARKLEIIKPSKSRNLLSAMNERSYNQIKDLCI